MRISYERIRHTLLNPLFFLSTKLNLGIEKKLATKFWSELGDFDTYFNDPIATDRSKFLAQNVFKPLNISSLLEVGCNSGRNLRIAKNEISGIRCKGIDVNANAIAYAQKKSPDIEFVFADANNWAEVEKSFDAILTMSVIDHIPDEAILSLAKNMVSTSKKIIVCVELWDGSEGRRGPYKYSRDLRKLFEPLGVETLRWEKSEGQYDTNSSLLYLYVGRLS